MNRVCATAHSRERILKPGFITPKIVYITDVLSGFGKPETFCKTTNPIQFYQSLPCSSYLRPIRNLPMTPGFTILRPHAHTRLANPSKFAKNSPSPTRTNPIPLSSSRCTPFVIRQSSFVIKLSVDPKDLKFCF